MNRVSEPAAVQLPEVGTHYLKILSPRLLELTLVNKKFPDSARVEMWDFVNEGQSLRLPDLSQLVVTADSQVVKIDSLGFKRRPLFAPLKKRDLRIGNHLYILLSSPLSEGQLVNVDNPTKELWGPEIRFVSVLDPQRTNPAIHVNQVGYMPENPKKAMVGYYLGSMGEMPISVDSGFQIIQARSGLPVYSGPLKARIDRGFTYEPKPYQNVYEADFSDFKLEGEYRLAVPGMGASLPFRIDAGIAAAFARTFALGLYHQRCGAGAELPFTRHVHGDCHTAPSAIPTLEPAFQKVQDFLSTVSSATEPRQTAMRLKDISSSLYPFVRAGNIDVSGGHHDAGDYSKYTINSAGLIHYLIFAADSLPGAGELDNLGLPESGDGRSDLLQEAKWEADFLAKMQDDDGGFYFLVYPKDRRYEDDVLPDQGDPQVVWPKTTAATAAAVAALAEAGSSPRMKKQFPVESAKYIAKAERGWSFLMNSIARFGKDGSYQKITHYGNEFIHDDELAWAAAALYAATGESLYEAKLLEWFPEPNSPSTRRWDWWRLFEGYGRAVRTYAFAARSGRLSASSLNKSYLSKCETEILAAADDHVGFAQMNAYGTSFPIENKHDRSAGWYFSSERAFDVTVAYQLTNRADFLETVVGNLNFEAGCNPLNMPFVTGLGSKRQRDIVHQYAQNDRRALPPSGLPIGNIQAGFAYLYPYTTELTALTFPPDNSVTAPYPYYDRWSDSFNTTTEFVITDQGRSLASLVYWMAQSQKKGQPWRGVQGHIRGLPETLQAGTTAKLSLVAPGIDLSDAVIVWEAQYCEPGIGASYSLIPKYPGVHWIEAEALLPDGRRVFATSNFVATTAIDAKPNSYQSNALALSGDMVALYHLDGDLADTAHKQAPLALKGNTTIDYSNQGWLRQHSGAGLRFHDLGDTASVKMPMSTLVDGPGLHSIEIEAMIYINQFKGLRRGVARLLSLSEAWNAYLEFVEDTYQGLFARGGTSFSVGGGMLENAVTLKDWHHLKLSITRANYSIALNGRVLATSASGELLNWGRGQFANLEIGNFDGWMDEMVVRVKRETVPQLPSIQFVTPNNGSIFSASDPISISVEVVQASSGIQKVEFFAGTTRIGEDFNTPFNIFWTGPRSGTYSITARAKDLSGRVGVSVPIETRVISAAGNSTLVPLGLSASGGLRILLRGVPGKTYAIQASHDYQGWTDIGVLTLTGDSSEFVDPAPFENHHFYRAVQVP